MTDNKPSNVAVQFTEEDALKATVVRLNMTSRRVSAAIFENAPALVFYKSESTTNNPEDRFDVEMLDPQNMVIVRFDSPEVIDVMLEMLHQAITPFVDQNIPKIVSREDALRAVRTLN